MGKQDYELGATLNSALTYKPDRGHGAMLQDQQPHQCVLQNRQLRGIG
jgi:hypothetical protein